MIGLNELIFTWISAAFMALSIIISMDVLSSSWGLKHGSISKIAICLIVILFVFFIIVVRMVLVDISFLDAFSNNATNATIGI